MAQRRFSDTIGISLRNYATAANGLRKEIANQAVNHFKDSFREQGFEDSHITPWKKRKKADTGRAILVRTGRLRRSFSAKYGTNKIVIINDTPYAVFHNYGTKKLPQRRFMGESKSLSKKFHKAILRAIKKAL